jgi:hypothetical protein
MATALKESLRQVNIPEADQTTLLELLDNVRSASPEGMIQQALRQGRLSASTGETVIRYLQENSRETLIK